MPREVTSRDIGQELLGAVAAEYPLLKKYLPGIAFKRSEASAGRKLEFYSQGERDSFDPSRPAVEVFGDEATPADLAGDVASHHLANGADPIISGYYKDFEATLSPQQKSRLQDQYRWHQENTGEKRPFPQWYAATGLPAYFRGHAFNQWENAEQMYTPDQIAMFGRMLQYMKDEP